MARSNSGVAVLLRRLQARPGSTADGEVLGLCERGALTTALALARSLGTTAIAIAVGPARREDRVLAMALRAGCERALRIHDAGIDELDYFGIGQVLATAARYVGAQVIICGDRSQDESSGAVGPAVADLLDASHLTQVARVDVDGSTLVVERAGDGTRQRFRVAPPVVLCVLPPELSLQAAPAIEADDLDDEAASTRTRRSASTIRVPTIEELDFARLGIEPRMLTHRKSAAGRLRPLRGRRRALLSSTADELVARLHAERVLAGAFDTVPATPRSRRSSSLPKTRSRRGSGDPGAGR